MLSSASGGGQAHQFCRPSSLAYRAKLYVHSAVSLSSGTRLPFIVSSDLNNGLAQWEVISGNVLPH